MESSILLGLNQIIAIATIIVWKKVGIKVGSRLGYFIALCILFIASIPMIFIVDFASALIVVSFAGLGFGGMLFFTTLLSADIIDQDELKTSVRREGAFMELRIFS